MTTRAQQPEWKPPPLPPGIEPPRLRIWNSLKREKTPFIPREKGAITWYACGPTVYDDAHLGHARNYVTTDILLRIMRYYFKFKVHFVMNVTDVDDKIILRARQQHLFSRYTAKNPIPNEDVLATATRAYHTYVKKNLPKLEGTPPDKFEHGTESAYAGILAGQALDGSEKPGDAEAKIKMHIKTARTAASAIATAATSPESNPVDNGTFYGQVQDVLYPYLDSLEGHSIGGNDYEIFTKLTQKFERSFFTDMQNLNNQDPDEITRVTEMMPQTVAFIGKIVDKGIAYVTSDGSVYFDIRAFEAAGNPYARLEPWNKGDLNLVADGEGSLTNKMNEKRSPADFALWKASRPGEPRWPSPWGEGRPGWHIECSAMASDKFSRQMDIHSGGIDLAFPHHDNELAQSEAYWNTEGDRQQWVNYFLHMGHLSIQGAKMAKSLKNFTTVKEALSRGDWTPRSLRIVFLLGTWNKGIEITPALVEAGKSFEEKVTTFFLNVNDQLAKPSQLAGSDDSLRTALSAAQQSVEDALCDSFDTPEVLRVLSNLITTYYNTNKAVVKLKDVQDLALWITKMLNIFGLNGTASSEPTSIGWQGIDIPEEVKPYVTAVSAMRDTLRVEAKSEKGVSPKRLQDIANEARIDGETSAKATPFADALTGIRNEVRSLGDTDNASKAILALCDEIRDVKLFDLGVYLEDRESGPALVRPLSKDMEQRVRHARAEKVAEVERKQKEREKREREAQEKAEKGKLRPEDMFRTPEFSAWDTEGIPTRDAGGEEITKSRAKKLKKDWERQKKAHDGWLASQPPI